MNVLLIKAGVVQDCISADSVDRAKEFFPDCECIERDDGMMVAIGWAYDGKVFTAPPAPPEDRRITQFAFITRFTDAEAIAIDLASQGATMQAGALRRHQAKMDAASWVNLDDAVTRNGVRQLEGLGLIAGGRAAAILDAPVQPNERLGGL